MDLKKVMAIGIAASMFMGSSAAAINNTKSVSSVENFKRILQEGRERAMVLESQIELEQNLKGIKDSDRVRVIIELDGGAVIDKATTKGLKVSEMNKLEVEILQKEILNNQTLVQNEMQSIGINFEILNSFTNVTNGFSLEATLAEAKIIEGIEGVKSVTIANEYDRPEPQMNSSAEITETVQAWSNGYTGEGTIISIIDTGIDSSHRDMVLTDDSKAELDNEEVQDIISENTLNGKYYTEKIPYGYNYMDKNHEIRHLGPNANEHGMHVAGIAGANGDTENKGIKGTAPEAQLLAMKVFGNNPKYTSTYGDIIIKAIDDSIILGADVINMSLGSSSAFVDDTDPEQAAVNRAVDNGILVSVSAGNSNVFGAGFMYPYTDNPDYGVVGSPGISTKSLQVASIENNMTSGFGIEFEIDGEEKIYPYTIAGKDILSVFKDEKLTVVDCGYGGVESDFPKEVKGNVALIERGKYDFTDKIINAEKAGAIAVIVFNNSSNGDELINMIYPKGGNIPALFMGHTGGKLIRDNVKNDGFSVSFKGNGTSAINTSAGKMSEFTSWGVTPDLEFKPEITAVGGNVWSTANNDSYKNMSGTSMSAPNVAGGAALVLQRVDELFDLTGEAKALTAKNILMSTAIPHKNEEGYYTSPRRQGAGVMNLARATDTTATVTDKTTGISKVNLKEINNDKATFTVVVDNFGKKELTYNIEGTVQTDSSIKFDAMHSILEPELILDKNTGEMPISFSENTITIEPNSSKELTITVDLSNMILKSGKAFNETFVNGGFVEGFVTLVDEADTNLDLSIPYVGFYGDWDKVPTMDASIYDKDRPSFYGFTSLVDADSNFYGLPYDSKYLTDANGDYIDISPNKDGYSESVAPFFSLLRNVSEFEIEVLDEGGNIIKKLAKEKDMRKNYYDNGKRGLLYVMDDANWDGTVNGKPVEEGSYTYRIKTKIDFEDAKWQNYDYKINVDYTAPEINNIIYSEDDEQLIVTAEDNQKGHVYAYLLETPLKRYVNANGIFDISNEIAAGYDKSDFVVAVSDYAQNVNAYDLSEPIGPVEGDKDAPVVMVNNPIFSGIYGRREITFSGTVTDVSGIDEVKINGEEISLVYNKEKKYWEFSKQFKFEDGYQGVKVYAKDIVGNEIEYIHEIYVDSQLPIIDTLELPAQTKDSSVFINGKATDNFPSLRVVINGSLVENIRGDFSYLENIVPVEYDFNNYEIKLEDGENNIIIEVTDAAGHIVTKKITVNKVDEIIDDKAPKSPTIERVDGTIVITVTDPEDTEKIQYSYDNETWTDYVGPIAPKEGSTIYAIAIDAAGNKSEVISFEIKDITPPIKPVIADDDGKITITKADEDTVRLEYSLDGTNWGSYVGPVNVKELGTIYARAIDAMENVSEITEYTVPDRTAPKAPKVTIKAGVLTITVAEDDTERVEYSLDGETWNEYVEPVKVDENTIVYVRAIDGAGNISEVKEYIVPSIINPEDIVAPAAPTVVEKDGVVTVEASDDITDKLEYSLDNGKSWMTYTEPVKVAEKASSWFRAVNIVEDKVAFSDVVKLTVPDRTAPMAPEMSAKDGKVTIKANKKDDDVLKIEYSVDGKETWIEYKEAVKLTSKKTIYARVIDEAGNVSEISKFTMPSSGNNLPQTGGVVGAGLMGLGGAITSIFGALMLKKKNMK